MIWKYIALLLLLIAITCIAIPAYRYLGSVDWSKSHSARIAALPILTSSDNSGEYRVVIDDFEFYVRGAGFQNEGPAVILLHGFPESSIMWSELIERAASDGFKVLAFDQRGYSPGARPKGVDNYHIDYLTNDVIAVADHMGIDSFHLVGHDWGAVIAWHVAMKHADRLRSLTTLSIPHIGVFFNAVRRHPEQMKRSSYFKRLQTPLVPEYKFVANNQQFYRQMMSANPEYYLTEYLSLFAEHGAATATLNWYRAMQIDDIVDSKIYEKEISTATLFIWGTEDGVIAPEIIPQQEKWIVAPYKEVALETGHGLIQSKPDTVIHEILAHFKKTNI